MVAFKRKGECMFQWMGGPTGSSDLWGLKMRVEESTVNVKSTMLALGL